MLPERKLAPEDQDLSTDELTERARVALRALRKFRAAANAPDAPVFRSVRSQTQPMFQSRR